MWTGPILFGLTLVFIAFAYRAPNAFDGIVQSRPAKLLLWITLALGFILPVVYLVTPMYYDHFEPVAIATGWAYLHGQPIFPEFKAGGAFYAGPYGPLYAELTALSLWLLGPSLNAPKFLFVLAFFGSCALLLFALKDKISPPLRTVFLALALACLSLSAPMNYWIKPDPALIFLSALAVFGALYRDVAIGALLVGLAIGAAVALKVHGPVYMFAPFVLTLGRAFEARRLVPVLLLGTGAAAVGAGGPFLLCGNCLAEHVRYLELTSGHHFWLSLFIVNLLVLAVLAAIPLSVGLVGDGSLTGRSRLVAGAFFLSAVPIIVLGSKAGAGRHHLLPLIPPALMVAALFSFDQSRGGAPDASALATRRYLAAVLAAVILVVSPRMASLSRQFAAALLPGSPAQREISELRNELRSYPNAQMGVGSDRTYDRAIYRVMNVFAGAPYLLDPAVWHDFSYIKDASSLAVPLLASCRIQAFTIPAGDEPFSTKSYYTGEPLFSDAFRRTFEEKYRRVSEGQYFDVWECASSRASGDKGEARAHSEGASPVMEK